MEKYCIYFTPDGKKIEGLEGPNNTIHEIIHYNKFSKFGTPIPEDSHEVFMSKEWVEDNRYGTKEYVPRDNSYFYNIRNKLTDKNYKKYFVGDGKYMVCVSQKWKVIIYNVPDNIIRGKLDYALEGRYHINEIKKYRYIIIKYGSDSILIRFHKFRYVFIGKAIFEFEYEGKIDSFGDDYIMREEGKFFIE